MTYQFITFLLIIFFSGISLDQKRVPLKEDRDSLVEIKISFVGDLMCHSPQFQYAEVNSDSFDFRPVYREVLKYFNEADFLAGNLETVIAGNGIAYSGYPFFNSPEEYVEALQHAGFDLLFTSNNHSLDKKENGLLNTIKVLDKLKINRTGTFSSNRDRDSIRVYDIKGIRVGFLSYTYGTNGIPVPNAKSYLINVIDTSLIKDDIDNLKKHSDLVIVYFHFGNEYKQSPSDYQRVITKRTIEYGADIIIGSHPHVLQPAEFFKTNGGKLDTGFVAYSLGNFISNQRERFKDAGVILNIDLIRTKDGKISISSVDYVPTWVFKGNTGTKNEYVILPSDIFFQSINEIDYLSETNRKKLIQSYFDTFLILTKFDKRIRSVNEIRTPLLIF